MGKAFSILVLCGAIALLQIHGIAFWSDKVGPLGILWSVLLEATALWLWYQRNVPKRALGLLASVMLLAGPLHQVAVPVLQAMEDARHADSMRVAQVSIIHDEISNLETSLETFRKNSESRSGWLNAIQKTEQQLSSARKELRGLLATPAQSALDWSQQGAVLMQATTLVLFQLTAILIITSLSKISNQRKYGNTYVEIQEAAHGAPSTNTAGDETQHLRRETMDIAKLTEQLDEHLSRQKLTAKEFSARHKLNPRDVSLIRNHSRRAAAGKQVAPPGAVRRVAEILAGK